VRLTSDHDALDVANKVGARVAMLIIRSLTCLLDWLYITQLLVLKLSRMIFLLRYESCVCELRAP
jgi:hypothetical protein